MANLEIRRDEIAKRYGGVLFDLVQQGKLLKPILKDIERLEACLQKEPRAWTHVVSPTLPLQLQRRIIKNLTSSLKLGELMRHFMLVLCQNRRLSNLHFILEEFKMRTQYAEGIIEGTLETATKISSKDLVNIQTSLKQQLGKDVTLNQIIKENLIAGIVLRIGSMMIDASLETQLKKLQFAMKG